MKNIIIVGSGWASASFLKNIDINKNDYNIIIISPKKNFTYTPLLVSSIFKNINIEYDILKINNDNNNNIKYISGKVDNINFNKNLVNINNIDIIDNIDNKDNINTNISNLSYDYLILAHGSDINTFNIQGVNEHCLFIKDTDNIKDIQDKLYKLKRGSNIAIIGTSLTGSELIGGLIDLKKFNIHALDGLNTPLSNFNKELSDYIIKIWEKNNVNLYMNHSVQKIDSTKIYCKDNKTIQHDLVFWCGGVKPSILTTKINNHLQLENKFGIPVDDFLKVKNTKNNNVYAIGDCGYNKFPPTAQVAYQEGKYIAEKFNSNFKNISTFQYKNRGQICYIGDKKRVYNYNKIYFHGNLTRHLNTFVHLYNTINFKQSIKISKDLYK